MFHVEHTKNIEDLLVAGSVQVGINLSDDAISKFTLYFDELRKWNAKINLTSLTSEADIITNLFLDSLCGSLALNLGSKSEFLDVGSGGGFPGLPLKIGFPEISVTLVEPKSKKVAFLHHVIGKLSLNEARVKPQTIEDFEKSNKTKNTYDYVLAKAIKPESVIPSALSLLGSKGRVCLYRSGWWDKTTPYLGMDLDREISYELPFGYGKRVLSILKPSSLN